MLVYTEQTIENWIIMLTVFCCSSHLLHLAEKWLSPVINACTGEVRFMIPGGGVPTLDAPRQPFREPLCGPPAKDVLVKTAYHINDPRFAQIVIEQFRSVTGVPNEFLPRALSMEKFFNPKKGPEN
ncbi:Tm-1-like ATP-binding domain-containing protein [Serratia liquefaciens]|uniref:Tm-1-like ATP-binding domain-containing protein n=1 Tax=Serratia liquefaciens TaxID=614 RepID=UPI0015A0B3F2|nr:Tm-1-like ATP-binding domain-containing protein [Serratia liquefaciens]NWA23260.1 Tm-1-like ATP-binding domain-containing protein [Serratia liquefaciens]